MLNVFNMGGYGWYIGAAYSSVAIFLFVQWLLPWRRWRRYLRQSCHE